MKDSRGGDFSNPCRIERGCPPQRPSVRRRRLPAAGVDNLATLKADGTRARHYNRLNCSLQLTALDYGRSQKFYCAYRSGAVDHVSTIEYEFEGPMTRLSNRYLAIMCVVLPVVLAGCALPHSHLVSKKEPLINKEHGVIVVSVGSGTMPDPAVNVVVTQSDGKPANFKITTDADWEVGGGWREDKAVRYLRNGGPKRLLLAYSALPGRYSINSVGLYISRGSVNYTGTVDLGRPLGFDVEAGKVTYIGVIEVDVITASNVLGEIIPALSIQVPSRMSVRVLDEFEADNKLLTNLRPELQNASVLRPIAR